MTEVCWRMLSDDEDDSPAKCRERRRRRIEMRRLAAISGASSPLPPLIQSRGDNTDLTESLAEVKRIRTAEKSDLPASSSSSSGEDVDASSAQQIEGPAREPVFGTMSVSGRSRGMEDAIGVRTSLCRPEISHYRPVHFFAVFDGHGGPHVLLAHLLLINFFFNIYIFFSFLFKFGSWKFSNTINIGFGNRCC
jgi:protein phosphatase 2C